MWLLLFDSLGYGKSRVHVTTGTTSRQNNPFCPCCTPASKSAPIAEAHQEHEHPSSSSKPQGDHLAPMKNQARQAGHKIHFTESRKQNPGGEATHTTGNSGGKKCVAKILPANTSLPQAS